MIREWGGRGVGWALRGTFPPDSFQNRIVCDLRFELTLGYRANPLNHVEIYI